MGQRKGAVLIIVLGVLFILALLATTFAQLQATEKQVARNYLDMVRAKLVAQSGIQEADSRLREYFPARYFDAMLAVANTPQKPIQAWKYYGQVNDELTEPTNLMSKLEEATNPSFAIEGKSASVPENPQNPDDTNVMPLQVTIEGKQRGVSGLSDNLYALNGNNYALKVSDLSGRIYVNDGLDQDLPGNQLKDKGSVSQNLARILNVLGDMVGVPNVGGRKLGEAIIVERPKGGYRHPQDLLKAVNYDDSIFNRIKDHVTVYAWVDPNVCLPVPLSQAMLPQYPVTYFRGTQPVYRMGSSKDAGGRESAPPGGYMTCPTACATLPHDDARIRIYGLDVLNPQWIEIVTRAPVNINTATREVLVSLLTDLRGWYVSDRRRNNPRWKGELYLSFKQQNSLSPAGTEGDEYGYLKETVPIVGPGGTATANSISAFAIADEIIACRTKTTGPKGFNYGDPAVCPWGGPLRSFAVFDQFVDNLVSIGVIVDNRPLHFDFEDETDDPTGFGALVPSAVQKRYAEKAAADVIKSNFNPNLHLNELNPDANTFRLVDKTDLIVNSTEFNFLPTGHFEVESLGRVLRPVDPLVGDCLNGNNELVATAKVTASFKFFELYRETNQRHFYAGTLSPNGVGYESSSGYSLEIGPEPDNGRAPQENEWGGYLQLPTVGSVFHSFSPGAKPKGAVYRTAQAGSTPHFGSMMHIHYNWDVDCHHHLVDPREIAGRRLPDENVENYPDLGLNYPGPYDPTKGPGFPHRLCRWFKQPPKGGTGGQSQAQLNLGRFAPSDLRIDGCYSERHSSPAYYTRQGGNALWNFSTDQYASGMVSFWFKPSYFPELTGKVRQVWDLGRYHRPCNQQVYVWPFQMIFLPAHYNTSISETNQPKYWHNNMGQFHPASMYWGTKQWHGDEVTPIDSSHAGHEFGKVTRSLNHFGHPDENVLPSVMIGHRWVHTTFAWTLNARSVPGDLANGGGLSRMWLNGTQNDIVYSYTSMTTWNERYDKMWGFENHAGGEYNHMRLGAPSKIANAAVVTALPGVVGAYRGNHTADFTVDEVYAWKTEADSDPKTTWLRGRYRKPDPNYSEGKFTSQAINLLPSLVRMPPPASAAVPPGGGAGSTPPSITTLVPKIRVLGVSWSWYGEGLNPATGLPALYNYNNPEGTPPRTQNELTALDMEPNWQITGIQDGNVFHPSDPPPTGGANDGFARVRDGKVGSQGGPAEISDPKQLKYVAQFSFRKPPASGSVLVTSPVLDDVTIYFDDAQSHMLSYVFDSRTW